MHITFNFHKYIDGVCVFSMPVSQQLQDADYPIQQMLDYDNYEPAYNLAVASAMSAAYGRVANDTQTITAELAMSGVTAEGDDTESVTIAKFRGTETGTEVTDFICYGTTAWQTALDTVASRIDSVNSTD